LEIGDYLFVEDAALEHVYLVEYGEVTLAKLKDETKIELMIQVEGDIVGVDILFKDGVCNYSAIANKSCKLFKTSLADFQAILSHQKATSLELVKYLCSLISEMEKRG
jgi:CRP-like cAMP-binding protein